MSWSGEHVLMLTRQQGEKEIPSFANMLHASRAPTHPDKVWFGFHLLFFFVFWSINWIFSSIFAVNCSLATLASDRRSLPVNPPGLLRCLTLKLAKRGRCTSLLDRHFFNYLLMLTISTQVESAIIYWDASCPDIFPNFVLYSLKSMSGVYLLLPSSDFQQIQINPWWWMQLPLRCKNNSTN